jgi:Xaa-Pro aminopeptidase
VVQFNKILPLLNEELKKQGITKLLIETENSISFLNALKKGLETKVSPSDALSARLADLRSVKRRDELNSIVTAQRIAEKAFDDILNFIKAGVTEKEIAALLEYKMKQYGAEGIAFDTIAVSGANSSLPHGVPTDKKVEAGDFITMDFGAVINGYCSDMTRTVAVGFVTDEMAKVYDTVLRANINTEKNIRAGITCKDADALARDVINEAGYGDFFGHGTGHGVGLLIHEKPTLSPKAEKTKLRAGQVVTDEPGIYLPEKFGVRIEDMLYVRKNDCKNLTKAPKHLIIL